MPKRYLYVPFSEDENNFPLELAAMNWSYRMKKSKNKKEFTAVIHGEDTFKDLEQGSTIYVLSHGVPDEYLKAVQDQLKLKHIVCNTNNPNDEDGVFFMTMDKLAKKMIDDGLLPKADCKIKLFFCDTTKQAKEIALSFSDALNNLNKDFAASNTRIYYYNAILAMPFEPSDENEKIFKRALLKMDDPKISGDIGCNKNTSPRFGSREGLKVMGRASEFRGQIPINQTLVGSMPNKPKKPANDSASDDQEEKGSTLKKNK